MRGVGPVDRMDVELLVEVSFGDIKAYLERDERHASKLLKETKSWFNGEKSLRLPKSTRVKAAINSGLPLNKTKTQTIRKKTDDSIASFGDC